ncbi:hypothetical protein LPJ53_001334 [Coemansia erecta]|uniref:TRIP4/RQT4 C2HC5-type zinc finger domain-containing protein n=1 Tax=Coemansia erecta TaxID=147472 RepID=A0A9W8CUN5_9FUNG|nr:hypothetical protein LPJ53_001334 [Coemansia erecta]
MNSRQLSADELAWTVGQVSMIVGAAQEDARPLAEFLVTIGSPTELQSQMLDMLGESPLALEFISSLISKRFLPETSEPASVSASASAAAVTAVAAAASAESTEPQQKQRKSKKQQRREQQERKEAEEKKRMQASRKRVRCDCQASEHPLLTNCLMCGRIVCDREGPGPCMFCGNDVQSPDQQLQQHMRRLLHREEPKAAEPKPKPTVAKGGGNSYSAKLTGGVATAPPAGSLLWDEGEDKDKSSENPEGQNPPPLPPRNRELSEEEYLQLAFEALGIDRSSATAEAQAEAEAWTRAMRLKERLLEYDRTAAQRSRLIDQASDVDVDAISKWMSPEEKAQAIAKIEAHKKAQEDREARLRSGTRVLRLNLGSGSVDLERQKDEEGEEARGLRAHQTDAVVGPAPSAKSSSNPARSSFFGDVAEPRFIPDDPSDSDSAKKPSKGKGKSKADASSLSQRPAQSDALAARRQMLRIQIDDDDSFAF